MDHSIKVNLIGTSHAEKILIKKSTSEALALRSSISIEDNGEELIEVPEKLIPRFNPHHYLSLGAPYGDASPFFLRRSVSKLLCDAQAKLKEYYPSYSLCFFDGYRPIRVQKYMIEYSFKKLARDRGLDPSNINQNEKDEIMNSVFQVWAPANQDPLMPPPHSTGGAVDLTIMDDSGSLLDMGSAIDALPPHSLPDYYEHSKDAADQTRHSNRLLLNTVMVESGFRRLPHEWWHFSYGDQKWALLNSIENPSRKFVAMYGRIDIS